MNSTDQLNVIRLEIPATHKYLNVLEACVSAILDRVESLSDRKTLTYNVSLAVHEACANIVQHAYSDQSGSIKAVMRLSENPRCLTIDLHDNGKPFDMPEIKKPNLDDFQINGYGLYIVHQLMDEVIYRPKKGDNRWRLVKNL